MCAVQNSKGKDGPAKLFEWEAHYCLCFSSISNATAMVVSFAEAPVAHILFVYLAHFCDECNRHHFGNDDPQGLNFIY